MANSIVRTDRWGLQPSPEQLKYLRLTQNIYRQFVRGLIGVVYSHYAQINSADSACAAIEKLIHRTKKNPHPKYEYFDRKFYKFPSYLRRAAIEFAIGQVSSFITRYSSWQSGQRKRQNAQPPKLNGKTNVYAVLYKGQCIKFIPPNPPWKGGKRRGDAEIKIFNGSDWVWITVKISAKRKRHLNLVNKQLSPTLIVDEKSARLSVPFKIKPKSLTPSSKIVAVDVGINTLATATVITSDGTVTARKFFHRAADIDEVAAAAGTCVRRNGNRRDKRLQSIRHKAKLTVGSGGKLPKNFCQKTYSKCHRINQEITQKISRQIVDFALAHGATVIVFENLKGWRPKGGKKRSNLKQKFHGWLHRWLVQLTTEKFAELGGKVELVYPRGTSSWAYDGSGQVKRSKTNYANAQFASGKCYNADLNGSQNIGARYWAWKLKLAQRNGRQLSGGKSSPDKRRMPVTLSTLWESEAPHLSEG
ncbi:MAG: IS200/IS605 family accessory protein TnpB-related protein [Spirulina sp.]